MRTPAQPQTLSVLVLSELEFSSAEEMKDIMPFLPAYHED
jgi:hypothetical protein